ncbi:MAG: flagellar type III secretion system pore protein FliP [Thermodesulfobacteriota bacterium]
MKIKIWWVPIILCTLSLFCFSLSWGQAPSAWPLPTITLGVKEAKEPGEIAVALQILILLTVLSLAPAILIMMTSFTRLIVVFSLLRHALSTQQMPPNQILIGLALFLTIFIMSPVWTEINAQALVPYKEKRITQEQALEAGLKPLRQFMAKQTREKDIALFVNIAKIPRPHSWEDIPTTVLIPAFMISELKTAFQIGCILYLPFLIIDFVVSSIILSMGMIMLPPVMISLPFKILLFVLVDGWNLLVGSLIKSFQ